VEAESECQLADPPASWQEHWFDHRQLLRLYHSDEHCAIYVTPACAGLSNGRAVCYRHGMRLDHSPKDHYSIESATKPFLEQLRKAAPS
jgi:hypothetical protein